MIGRAHPGSTAVVVGSSGLYRVGDTLETDGKEDGQMRIEADRIALHADPERPAANRRGGLFRRGRGAGASMKPIEPNDRCPGSAEERAAIERSSDPEWIVHEKPLSSSQSDQKYPLVDTA